VVDPDSGDAAIVVLAARDMPRLVLASSSMQSLTVFECFLKLVKTSSLSDHLVLIGSRTSLKKVPPGRKYTFAYQRHDLLVGSRCKENQVCSTP
jgi:hypothetical protein